jgi:hypothetical protein
MGHFKSNLRDIEFNLFEVLKRQDLLGADPYPELDEETARGWHSGRSRSRMPKPTGTRRSSTRRLTR